MPQRCRGQAQLFGNMCTVPDRQEPCCGGETSGHVCEPCTDHDGSQLGQPAASAYQIAAANHRPGAQRGRAESHIHRVKVFSGIPVCNQIRQHSVRLPGSTASASRTTLAGAFNNEGAQFINGHGPPPFFSSIRQTVLFFQSGQLGAAAQEAGVAGRNGSFAPKALPGAQTGRGALHVQDTTARRLFQLCFFRSVIGLTIHQWRSLRRNRRCILRTFPCLSWARWRPLISARQRKARV